METPQPLSSEELLGVAVDHRVAEGRVDVGIDAAERDDMGDAVVGGCGDHILVVEQDLGGVAVAGNEDQRVDVPEGRPECRAVTVLRDGDADTGRL